MTPADRLRQLLAELQMTQADLARATGVSPSLISDVARGTRKPSSSLQEALLDKFGISATWLVLGKGPMRIVERTEAQDPMSRIESALRELTSATSELSGLPRDVVVLLVKVHRVDGSGQKIGQVRGYLQALVDNAQE